MNINMFNIIDGCPSCGTRDWPLTQGPNLYLCPFCSSLYSAIETIVNGVDVIHITLYTSSQNYSLVKK